MVNTDLLTPEEIQLLNLSKPKDGDIDDDGASNIQRIQEELEKLLSLGQQFTSLEHLFQFTLAFAGPWGFHVKKDSKDIVCSRGKSKNYKHTTHSSPNKRRVRSNFVKVNCPFIIKTGLVDGSRINRIRKKDDPEKDRRIQILYMGLSHSDLCRPSVDSQVITRKHTGYYSSSLIPPKKLEYMVQLLDKGRLPSNVLRGLLAPYLPKNYSLSSTDLSNFRLRAKLQARIGNLNDISEHTSKAMFKSLDEDFSFNPKDVEACSRDLLREALQDDGEGWKAIKYMDLCKRRDPHFDYRLSRNQQGKPTGIVYMTGEMREAFIQHGDIISLDCMKREYNKLKWPYIGPVVLDGNYRVASIAECVCIEESFDAYAFIMNSVFEMEPRRHRSSISAIFGDCIMTPELLRKIEIHDSCRIFWDHWHLLDKIWKPHFGLVRFHSLDTIFKNYFKPQFVAYYRVDETNPNSSRTAHEGVLRNNENTE